MLCKMLCKEMFLQVGCLLHKHKELQEHKNLQSKWWENDFYSIFAFNIVDKTAEDWQQSKGMTSSKWQTLI